MRTYRKGQWRDYRCSPAHQLAHLTCGYKSLLISHHWKVIMAMFRRLTSGLNPSQTCMYLVDVH